MLVPDVAEVKFVCTGASPGAYATKGWSMSLHVRDTATPWIASHVGSLAGRAVTWFETEIVPLMSASWILEEVRVRDLGAAFGQRATEASGAVGTMVGDELPLAIAHTVSLQGAGGSAPRQGWKLPPLGDETVVTDGQYTQAFVDLVSAAFTAFNDALDSVVFNEAWVIVSRAEASEAEKAAIKAARQDLRDAIAAANRAEGVSNTISVALGNRVPGSVRDRR